MHCSRKLDRSEILRLLDSQDSENDDLSSEDDEDLLENTEGKEMFYQLECCSIASFLCCTRGSLSGGFVFP